MKRKLGPGFRLAGHVLLLALAYIITGRLALLLAIPPGFATAIFPPVGVGLAAVLVWGYPMVSGVLVGSTLLNLSIAWSAGGGFSWKGLLVAFGIAVGSSLHNIVGAWLLRRFVGIPATLSDEREVILFLLLGGPVACLISATWGVLVLFLAGAVGPSQFWFSWWTWWVGDGTGVMIASPLTLILFSPPRTIWRSRLTTVGIPLIVSCAIMVVVFVRASAGEQENVQRKFQEHAKLMEASIRFHLDMHSKAVHAVERFFIAAPESKHAEFHAFVAELQETYPGLYAASWNRVVKANERAAYEKDMATEAYPGFTITERSGPRGVVPAGSRDEYVVVTYIEPYEANARAIGFDVASDATRHAALSRARDRDEPIMTAPIELVQAPDSQRSILLMMPVYEGTSTPSTEAGRRQALRGYATTVLRVDQLVHDALASYSTDGYQLQIRDITDPDQPEVLLGSPMQPTAEHAKSLVWTQAWLMAGRRLELTVTPDETFLQAHRSLQSWMVLVFGLILCSLLGAFLLVVSGKTSQIQQLVEQRTLELSAILDNAAEAIVTLNADGHIERANPATATLFAYDARDLPGHLITELLPDFDWNNEALLRGSHEVAGYGKDGSVLTLEMALSRVELRGRTLFTCMLHDISERKRVERLKSEFVSTVSHELRTPLTSITGALGLIAGGVMGEISPEVREMVDISRINAERLTTLVNDILDIEKLESGQIELRNTDIEVSSLLRQAMVHNSGYADGAGVRLVLDEGALPDEPLKVYVDPSRVLQVLANLMSNAIKFSPPAGEVVITAAREGAFARVVVRDNGSGIPEEFRSRIFQKFAQADGTDARQRGGTGLGLSISKAIVERMGGTIGFAPNPDGGTIFYFTLPIST